MIRTLDGRTITNDEAIKMMADTAERLNVSAEDVVRANGLGFYACFCLEVELANRNAIRSGYKSEVDRAYTVAEQNIAARLA